MAELLLLDGPRRGERIAIGAHGVALACGEGLLQPVAGDGPDVVLRVAPSGGSLRLEPTGRAQVQVNRRTLDGPRDGVHGDLVECGGAALFVCLRADAEGLQQVLCRMETDDLVAVVEQLGGTAGYVSAFFRIAREIQLKRSLRGTARAAIEGLLAELPDAERGVCYLDDDSRAGAPFVTASRGKPGTGRINRTVVDEVRRSREAILARGLLERGPVLELRRGDRGVVVTSACAPLVDEGGVAGALMIDSTRQQPFAMADLQLVTAVAGQLSHALERQRLQRMEAARQFLEAELSEARGVQQFLLPRHLPDVLGIQLAMRSSFCQKLGGDYYDAFWLDERHVALVVADVSGHGISSALVMAMARSVIRSHCRYLRMPAAVLEETNRAIRQGTQRGMFVTVFLGFLNIREMTLTYANAGHPFPLLFAAGEDAASSLGHAGFPVGLREEGDYREAKQFLKRGDMLVLYTDGVVEAKDRDGHRFGRERLEALVRQSPGDAETVANTLFSNVTAHLGGQAPADDASIMTLAVDPEFDSVNFEVASVETNAEAAIEVLARFAADHGFLPAARRPAFRLLMREANANAISHGNRSNPGKQVRYYARCDSRKLRISVADEGAGFKGNRALERLDIDTRTSRGRGLFLMVRYADRVTYNERGNEVTLELRRDGFGRPPE